MPYKKKLFWLIAISTLLRVVIASSQELNNVEVYYWVLATKLQWNYFDHPPMVAWLIRLTTANLMVHSELFVRLGAIISAAICTWLIFKTGTLLNGEKAGWFTAVLYTTSLYCGVNIAAFILPDSPQMIFWLASVYFLLRIARDETQNSVTARYWLFFGIFSGLCIMSKVHGVFLWVGALSYFLIYNRSVFRSRAVYIAAGIAFLIALPILVWNIQNDFITWKFHSSRVTLEGGIHVARFCKQFIQMVFSTGPIQLFLIGAGFYWLSVKKPFLDKASLRIILLCTLPLILSLGFISIFREVLPHWPGPALSTLLILPGAYLARVAEPLKIKLPGVLKAAIIYGLVTVVLELLIVPFTPGTLSHEQDKMKTGTDDVTLDTFGWDLAGKKIDSLYYDDVARGIMPARSPIIVTNYIPAGHIDCYIAHRTGQQTIGLGTVYDLHQYYWLNKFKRPLLKGDSAYYIIPSNRYTYKTFNHVIDSFNSYNFALIFPVTRLGITCKNYYVIRLYGFKGKADWQE